MPKIKMINYNGQLIAVEDVTPTWEQITPTMLLTLEHLQVNRYQTREQREAIETMKKEFQRMAQSADKWNAYVKENNGEPEPDEDNENS